MDRRQFLRGMFGATGGIVAATTMAQAGMWAEFMDWLKRAPTWSFPDIIKRPQLGVSTLPLFDEINAVTLDHLRNTIVFDNFFQDSPMLKYFRVHRRYDLDVRQSNR